MNRIVLAGFGSAVMLLGSALGAQALPLPGSAGASPLVEKVAEGCGPGFFRGPRGFCRPMGYGRPFYGPRPYYARPYYRPRPYWARPHRHW